MADDKQMPVASEEPSVEGTSTSEPEGSAPDAKGQESVGQAPKSKEETANLAQESGESSDKDRPSRAERRIRELTSKLKEAKQTSEQNYRQSMAQKQAANAGALPWSGEEPLVTPGQELSQDEFTNIVNQKAAQIAELQVRKVLSEKESRDAFSSAVDSWVKDSEGLQKENAILDKKSDEYDEDIATAFSGLVEKMNTDEYGRVMPKVLPSQIWEDFSKALKKQGKKQAGEVSASMIEKQAKGAIRTGRSVAPKSAEYQDQEAFKAAQAEGTVDSWAAYLKQRRAKQK